MKKLIAGLITAFLMSAGLVAATGATSANAVATCPAYQTCTPTFTSPSATNVKKGKKSKVTVKVLTPGNVSAAGSVTVTITGPGGFSQTLTGTISGGKVKFTTKKLKKAGKYTVTVSTVGSTGFLDSVGSTTIKVTKVKKKK